MLGSLFAVSDLHSSYEANWRIIDDMRSESGDESMAARAGKS